MSNTKLDELTSGNLQLVEDFVSLCVCKIITNSIVRSDDANNAINKGVIEIQKQKVPRLIELNFSYIKKMCKQAEEYWQKTFVDQCKIIAKKSNQEWPSSSTLNEPTSEYDELAIKMACFIYFYILSADKKHKTPEEFCLPAEDVEFPAFLQEHIDWISSSLEFLTNNSRRLQNETLGSAIK